MASHRNPIIVPIEAFSLGLWLTKHPNLGAQLEPFRSKLAARDYESAFRQAVNIMQSLQPITADTLIEYMYVSLSFKGPFTDPGIKKLLAEISQFDAYSRLWQSIFDLYQNTTGHTTFQEDLILKNKEALLKHITALQQRFLGDAAQPKDNEIVIHKHDDKILLTWVLEAAIDFSKQKPGAAQKKTFANSMDKFRKAGINIEDIKATASWIQTNWHAVCRGMQAEWKANSGKLDLYLIFAFTQHIIDSNQQQPAPRAQAKI